MRVQLDIDSQVRDAGRTVWSCHQGTLAGEVEDFQALFSALGHPELYSEMTELVHSLVIGDLEESATLIYEEAENREVSIEVSLI